MTDIRDAPVGLRWTGHPLVDMGVAGLTVFAQQRQPENVTGAHLELFAEWAEDAYLTAELKSWISVAFTSNFPTANQKAPEDEKRRLIATAVRSYKSESHVLEMRCTFFDRPAQFLVAREYVPMLTGREPINFFPDGQPRLPVSGLAITALQGLSVAAPLTEGRLLIVAADDPKLLLQLVMEWQPDIRKRVQTSNATEKKWSFPKTRLIEKIDKLEKLHNIRQNPDLEYSGSAAIYHTTNSGQGPTITIYSLALPALHFIRKAQNIKYVEAWQRLVASTWREPGKDKDPQHGKSNGVYESVFDLPHEASKFIRRFFLSPLRKQLKPSPPADIPKRGKKAKAVQAAPPKPSVPPVALWNLLELFLQEVLGMEKTRIEQIRTLADRLANLVKSEDDKSLFRKVYNARYPHQVRTLLIQESRKQLLRDSGPTIRMDEYLSIFEEAEELARVDFSLAWDLTKIRFLETLFDVDWIQGNKETLEDLKDTDQDEEEKEI
jgi:CRISPR-associated protein Cst1